MLDDVSIDVLRSALQGLSARQNAISDNIANVNTPYFRARRVDFEAQLKGAVADGTAAAGVTPATSFTTDAENPLTHNNVDLTAETMSGVQTELRYDLALRATGDRFSILRTAIKGS